MTKQEMTEIFSVMMLAWPNAEMFKGGIPKLGPTVTLWAKCLEGVDFWIGQQAVFRLCQSCKFPPSIAEFLDCSKSVTSDYQTLIDTQGSMFRMKSIVRGYEAAYQELGDGSIVKQAIDCMGGVEHWSYQQYEARCWEILKSEHISKKGQAQPRLMQQGGKP